MSPSQLQEYKYSASVPSHAVVFLNAPSAVCQPGFFALPPLRSLSLKPVDLDDRQTLTASPLLTLKRTEDRQAVGEIEKGIEARRGEGQASERICLAVMWRM